MCMHGESRIVQSGGVGGDGTVRSQRRIEDVTYEENESEEEIDIKYRDAMVDEY
jgi:hypothetical protein